MKVKLYIEKILKIGGGVCGFAMISAIAVAQEIRPYVEDTQNTRSGIQDTRYWGGFETAKEGLQKTIEVNQLSRDRVKDGVRIAREDLHKARAAYREFSKNNPERLVSSGVAAWLTQAEERYAAAKEVADLYRDIARLQMQQEVDKLTAAAQTLKYAHLENSFSEALGERGDGAAASNKKGENGVEKRALHLRLSEALTKSSEVASEHAASGFIMDKLNVFENGRTFEFAKEDYFDDFKEKYEKGTQDEVDKDILRDNKESKIERIAAAAERGERRRAEKAERNEDKVEKAEVKEEKKAEKAEAKEEKKAEKGDDDKDKEDKGDGGGGKKGKRD